MCPMIFVNTVVSSVRSCGIQMKTILQEILKISILDMKLKITDLKITALWVNELRTKIILWTHDAHGIPHISPSSMKCGASVLKDWDFEEQWPHCNQMLVWGYLINIDFCHPYQMIWYGDVHDWPFVWGIHWSSGRFPAQKAINAVPWWFLCC